MLGAKINYKKAISYLTKDLHVEWVHNPFLDRMSLTHYTSAAIKNEGKIEIYGEMYTIDEMEKLSTETEGRISEFTFGPGGSEGYILLLKMESCQILKAKTFDRNTFELFMNWVNALESSNYEENYRKLYEAVPVGSILYVVDLKASEKRILPYRLERYDPPTSDEYPFRLVDVSPGSSGTYLLSKGWESWSNIFYRIEDAIAFLNNNN